MQRKDLLILPQFGHLVNQFTKIDMQNFKKARLVLQDGTVYEGTSFGYEKSVSGEVVFYTAMTGYSSYLSYDRELWCAV